jgi:hypothetical protein
MLSYLKDAEHLPAAEQMNTQPQDSSAPVSGPADYLTVAGHGQKLKQSTMVLCVLFAVGAAAVWFMIKKTSPVTASAASAQDQLQIEAALAQVEKMKTQMDTEMNTVVGRFYQFSDVRQISVDELKKNPFRREVKAKGAASTATDEALAARQQQKLLSEAQQETQKLELWSITSTPRGMCCMIGEKVLYTGDRIGEMQVESIYPKRVVLNYKGIPVELAIE